MKQITVLLADDHMIVREGFRRLLEVEKDLIVIGEAQTGSHAVELAMKLRPAVVVMDIAMPILNGLEATRQLRKLVPNCKVLILSAHSDDAYITRALQAGAAGFMFKQSSANTLSQAIRAVHQGKPFFSPAIARRLRHLRLADARDSNRNVDQLSSRETEVLQLIAEGKANKETAKELGISIKTVEKHRAQVMKKLEIHDTASLTRYAIREGIIESSFQLKVI